MQIMQLNNKAAYFSFWTYQPSGSASPERFQLKPEGQKGL